MADLNDLYNVLIRIEDKLGKGGKGSPAGGGLSGNGGGKKEASFGQIGSFLNIISGLSNLPGFKMLSESGIATAFSNAGSLISIFSKMSGMKDIGKISTDWLAEGAKSMFPNLFPKDKAGPAGVGGPKSLAETAKIVNITCQTCNVMTSGLNQSSGKMPGIGEGEEGAVEGEAGEAAVGGEAAAAGPVGLIIVAVMLAIKQIETMAKALADIPRQIIGLFSDIKDAASGPAIDIVENLGAKVGDRIQSLTQDFFALTIPLVGEYIGKLVGGFAKFITQIILLPFVIKQFGEQMMSMNLQFAEMSPAMAQVSARWEVFNTMLNQRIGEATAGTASSLEEKLEGLMLDLEPTIVGVLNILNVISGVVIDIARWLNTVLIQPIVNIYNGLVEILKYLRIHLPRIDTNTSPREPDVVLGATGPLDLLLRESNRGWEGRFIWGINRPFEGLNRL